MQRIEFYYDLVSPYSYLAYGRVRRICEENGAELVLRPMLLGAVTQGGRDEGPDRDEAQGQATRRGISGAGPSTTGCRWSFLIPSPSAP